MDIVAEYRADRACLDRVKTVLSEGEMSRSELGRRCSAHPTARVQGVIDGLKESGRIAETIIRQGRGVRTMLRLSEPKQPVHDPLLVRMSEEAAAEQAVCVARLNGWFSALDADRTLTPTRSAACPVLVAARDMLVMLHRTPWKYAVEAPLWTLTGDVADVRGDTAAKKAARKLADLGAIVLKERRGRGRTSTFRLAHLPPWPMG
jgi:hypothetical protein